MFNLIIFYQYLYDRFYIFYFINLKDFNESSLCLNFLDEVEGVEVTWSLDFVSAGAAEAIINSIRPPWEELFSVPLQINGPQVPASSGVVATTET